MTGGYGNMTFNSTEEEIKWLEEQLLLIMTIGELNPKATEWRARLKELKELKSKQEN